jgi:predicted nuclease of predicted toxin-antitoxin system
MKLIFDENISFKLCKRLNDIYPGSTHVRFVGLETNDDNVIWQYALKNKFVIVTQDSDFNDISAIKGFPPFIVWLKTGNSRVSEIENTLRINSIKIRKLFESESLGLIEIE